MEKQIEQSPLDWRDGWNPRPGEVLEGTFVGYLQGQDDFGPCNIAVIQESGTDQTVHVWLHRTMLQKWFEGNRPRAGDRLSLEYRGSRTGRKGQRYHDYELQKINDCPALPDIPPEMQMFESNGAK